MKNTLETRLGLFAALIIIATFFILLIVGGFDDFRQGKNISALFETAQELKTGDRVKMAGVEIGKVEEITIDSEQQKVRVSMRLYPDAPVRQDAVARIQFAGLMGQNFVSINFGSESASLVSEGDQIGSIEQADLAAIMQKLDNVASGIENVTKTLTGDKIDGWVEPFVGFMRDNRGPLTSTISNIHNASLQIASQNGTVGKLIYDDSLYNTALATVSNLQTTGNEVREAVAEAKQIFTDIEAGKGTIGKLVTDETLYNETTASMTELREILEKVNRGDGTIGKLVNEQEFYKNAKLTLQKINKMTEGLEDQGPLSVLGILANNLF